MYSNYTKFRWLISHFAEDVTMVSIMGVNRRLVLLPIMTSGGSVTIESSAFLVDDNSSEWQHKIRWETVDILVVTGDFLLITHRQIRIIIVLTRSNFRLINITCIFRVCCLITFEVIGHLIGQGFFNFIDNIINVGYICLGRLCEGFAIFIGHVFSVSRELTGSNTQWN